MFKALNMFKTELTEVLESSDTVLPIPSDMAQILCNAIGDGGCIPCDEDPQEGQGEMAYTRLTIFHNGYHEIVKVTSCSGGLPVIERGQEGTTPRKFAIGTCVQFIWTAANVQCAIHDVVAGNDISDYPDGCTITV